MAGAYPASRPLSSGEHPTNPRVQDRIQIMGILNVTPDSFYDGGRYNTLDQAVRHARTMVEEGVDIIDVGGESTHPGAKRVCVTEELDRVMPVLEKIVTELGVPISIDTSKPEVMREAVAVGASHINDVRALQEPGALKAAAELGVPVCLMHLLGEPDSMQQDPTYVDVVAEVKRFLEQRIRACVAGGIPRDHILIDPGFGFGKTLAHNLSLLRHLDVFTRMGLPVLVGLSRKSMIGMLLHKSAGERLYASLALAVLAVIKGASIVRVHDVAATVDVMRTVEAVLYE